MSDRAASVHGVAEVAAAVPLPLDDLRRTSSPACSADFSETSGSRVVRTLEVARDGDDLFCVVAARRRAGRRRHRRRGRCRAARGRCRPTSSWSGRGCLFRLPPADTAGRLAVHVANGRGVKELLEQGLARASRLAPPGVVLAIERLGQPEASALGGRSGQGRAARPRRAFRSRHR